MLKLLNKLLCATAMLLAPQLSAIAAPVELNEAPVATIKPIDASNKSTTATKKSDIRIAENKISNEKKPVATLRNVKGKVEVSTNGKSEKGAEQFALYPGNKVAVQDNSAVTLVYADGCKKELTANTSAVVKDANECRLGALVVQSNAPAPLASSSASLTNGEVAAITGVAVLGVGAIAVAVRNNDGKDRPNDASVQ